jgi:transcriptional regulator with XRE-family HTH domain
MRYVVLTELAVGQQVNIMLWIVASYKRKSSDFPAGIAEKSVLVDFAGLRRWKMLDRKEIGKRILRLMKLAGKDTQTAIAEKLDVSQRLVSDWTVGKVFPRLPELEKIVEFTGCTWDWLLEGKETYPAEAMSGRTLTHVQLGVMEGLVRKLLGELDKHEDYCHQVQKIASSLHTVMHATTDPDQAIVEQFAKKKESPDDPQACKGR